MSSLFFPKFAFLNNFGTFEIILILVIVLLVFGGKKIPSLAKDLGTGLRNFKDAVTGKDDDGNDSGSSKKDHKTS